MKSPFTIKSTEIPELNNVQREISSALELMAAQILGPPTLVSFVVLGNNAQGTVVLSPIRDESGALLRRAEVGMRVFALMETASATDRQTEFEQTISVSDQIQQRSGTNLSAVRLFVVLVK